MGLGLCRTRLTCFVIERARDCSRALVTLPLLHRCKCLFNISNQILRCFNTARKAKSKCRPAPAASSSSSFHLAMSCVPRVQNAGTSISHIGSNFSKFQILRGTDFPRLHDHLVTPKLTTPQPPLGKYFLSQLIILVSRRYRS